ncbi:MAG: hypothetical protein AAGE52_21960 [Myxococcota bacterium]
MRISLLGLLLSLFTTSAAFAAPEDQPLELALEGHVFSVLFAPGDSDSEGEFDAVGFGGGLSLRYFGTRGHGLTASVRARAFEEFCIIFCNDTESGVLTSATFGYAYRADFGVRPHRELWFDFTPRAALEVGYISGDYGDVAFGGEVGGDFNIHFRSGVLLGVGGFYEIIRVTGGASHGGGAMLRIGGAFGRSQSRSER